MSEQLATNSGAGLTHELCQLVDGCMAGQGSALRSFIDRYQGPVFGLCYRMLTHRQDAEDMAQETFIRAFRSLHHWDRTREILPWLLSIAGNRCRTLLQLRKRRASQELLADQAMASPDQELETQHWQEELSCALERLRPDYRQAFLLFYEQELPYDQIAVQLNCPLGTVKTWIHRARKEIVTHLRVRQAIPSVETLNS
jgi:RNA polymerase sigma-70 factor, ECF subfamily